MTWVRVIRRTVVPTPFQDDLYDVHLELSNANIEQGPGGGGVVILPHRGCTEPTVVQYKPWGSQTVPATPDINGDLTLTSTPTAGNLFVLYGSKRDSTTIADPTGAWTLLPQGVFSTNTDGAKVWYRTVTSSDTATVNVRNIVGGADVGVLIEVSGSLTLDTSDESTGNAVHITTPTVTPTAGQAAIVFGFVNVHCGELTQPKFAPDSGWTEVLDLSTGGHPQNTVVYQTVASTSGSYTPGTTLDNPNGGDGYAAQTAVFVCSGSSDPPPTGQWIYNETPTPAPGGGRVTFSTAWPFADGSLHVWVDQVDQTAAIVSFDGAAGTFTLAFDPRSDEAITVSYQGR